MIFLYKLVHARVISNVSLLGLNIEYCDIHNLIIGEKKEILQPKYCDHLAELSTIHNTQTHM